MPDGSTISSLTIIKVMKKSASSISTLLAICVLGSGNLLAQTTAQNLSGPGYINLSGGTFETTSLPANAPSLMWSPGLSAFRFGYFDSTSAGATIGQNSLAGGYGSSATGNGSVALGLFSHATADRSLAIGLGAQANAIDAIALGLSSTVTPGANEGVALAGATVTADAGIAMGLGDSLGSFNGYSQTSGMYAFSAIGGVASGAHAVAFGSLTTANGSYSTALGVGTTVDAMGGAAIGTGNLDVEKDGVTVPNNTVPGGNDPIFEVGNGYLGTDDDGNTFISKSNALTIYRDGTIQIYKAQGGISMGQFQ